MTFRRRAIAVLPLIVGGVLLAALAPGIPDAVAGTRITVRNGSGNSIGSIDADGTIRNGSGSSIGRFDGGTVRNGSGSSIGRVDSDGTIRNGSGSSIGRVDSNGTLRNGSGSSIGRIDSDGTVLNGGGSSRGRFEGYTSSDQHVAAAYLFFFDHLHEK